MSNPTESAGGTATVESASSNAVTASTPAATVTTPSPAAAPVPWSKPAEQAPAAATPAAKPADVKITVPKDSFLNPTGVEKLTALARERGLTSEQVQATVDALHSEFKAHQDEQMVGIADQAKAWEKQLKADKEIGGGKWVETEQNVMRVMEYGDPDGSYRKEIAAAGLSFHPGTVKFLNRLGAAMKEGRLDGPTNIPPEKDTRSVEDKLKDNYGRKSR